MGHSRRERLGARVLAAGLVIAAVAYLALEAISFLKGNRGELRGALISFYSVVLALCVLAPRWRFTIPVVALINALSMLGILVLLLRSPAASIFGLTPGNPGDFDINYSGAVELYRYGGSPYGIEGKYGLDNPSVSFPFPTYAIYWLCSGFGAWSKAVAALNFTALNLIAALVLIRLSFRLSSAEAASLPGAKHLLGSLVAMFLALNSPFWLAVLEGQTPVMASCLMVLGLWCARKHVVLSASLLALASMIKLNFAALLLYFPVVFFRTVAFARRLDAGWPPARIVLLAVAFVGLFVAISLLFPRGVRQTTYRDFATVATPVLAVEATGDRRNISIFGLANAVLPTRVPPTAGVVVLAAASVAFGLWYRPTSWMIWLVIPLLISPITWTFYLGLALPVQFAIVSHCVKRERFVDLALLVASTGFLWVPRNVVFLGAVAPLVMFWLALQLDPGELIAGNA